MLSKIPRGIEVRRSATRFKLFMTPNGGSGLPHSQTLAGQSRPCLVYAGIVALALLVNSTLVKGAANIVVAADGAGDFRTLQAAVDSVAEHNQVPVEIFLRNGTYDGVVYIPAGKNHIHLRGEDRRRTIVSGRNNEKLNSGSKKRALVNVEANDFTAENLTIHNTTPYKGSQAEALRINGDKCVLRNCDFLSFQDTLQLSGRVYVTNCYIEGDVDFIWGQGTAFFEKCKIKAMHSGYYVQSRNTAEHLGYVFVDCKLTASPEVEKCWLARIESERFPHSEVAFIHCQMGAQVPPAGWLVTGSNVGGSQFAEFQSRDLDGKAVNVSRRLAASKQLSADEALALSDPVKVFAGPDSWNPRSAPVVIGGERRGGNIEHPISNIEHRNGEALREGQRSDGADVETKMFDVRQFGAKGDGTNLDTVAIQNALDECGKAGGGTVRLSSGTYLSKPIFLRDNMTLQLEANATLKATDEEADFADPAKPGAWRAFIAFVNGRHLTNVSIIGPGTIDGSGERWWGPAREAKRTNTLNPGYTLPRPKMVVLTGCRDVRVANVTLMNSPCFHLVPTDCENVLIADVTINAPSNSPNTDAIDPSNCRHLLITRCRLDVGDDNVAIKSGHAIPGRPACEDITVTDCTMLHGHGMSIGSETSGGVRNVLVRHCTFQNTENGLRIKSPRGKGGMVENVVYEDITMKDVNPAILFTCYYPKIPKTDAGQAVTSTTPIFRNLRISNLTATCTRNAGTIVGLPESMVSGVVIENTSISAASGLTIQNAKGIRFKNVQVVVANGPPYIIENAQVEGMSELPAKAPEK